MIVEDFQRSLMMEGYRNNFVLEKWYYSIKNPRFTFSQGCVFFDKSITDHEYCVKIYKAESTTIPIKAKIKRGAGKKFTFSLYVFSYYNDLNNFTLTLKVQTANQIKQSTLKINFDSYSMTTAGINIYRPYTILSFDHEPQNITIFLEISNDVYDFLVLNFTHPFLEEGKFPTSVVSEGGYRAIDIIEMSKDFNKNFKSGLSLLLVFKPYWNYEHVSDKESPCFFYTYSEDTGAYLSVCFLHTIDKLCFVVNDNIKEVVLEPLNELSQNDINIFCISISNSQAIYYINGRVNYLDADFKVSEFTNCKTYIGNKLRDQSTSCFSGLCQLMIWDAPLSKDNILELNKEFSGSIAFFRATMAAKGMVKYFTPGSWGDIIVDKIMSKLDGWKKVKPKIFCFEKFEEEDVRDYLFHSLDPSFYQCEIEEYSSQGRTDMLFKDGEKKLRLELKIWGRNDYTELPQKPLKYMFDDERIGAVLLINPNKRKRITSDYLSNIDKTDCGLISKIYLPNDYQYETFITTHNADGIVVEIYHIIYNVYPFFAK